MNKKTYIDTYIDRVNRIHEDSKERYGIDNDYIYSYDSVNSKWLKYPIDKILTIINESKDVLEYLRAFSKGDTITYNKFGGDNRTGTVVRVNYKRNGKISTITIKQTGNHTTKIKPEDIVYKDIKLYEYLNVHRHLHPAGYRFFDKYDIENADRVYTKLINYNGHE